MEKPPYAVTRANLIAALGLEPDATDDMIAAALAVRAGPATFRSPGNLGRLAHLRDEFSRRAVAERRIESHGPDVVAFLTDD